MASPTPLRRELLASLGVIFVGATLFLAVSLMMVLPLMQSTGETVAFILTIVIADLIAFLVFGGWIAQEGSSRAGGSIGDGGQLDHGRGLPTPLGASGRDSSSVASPRV